MRYQVFNHTSNTPIAEFDRITFCIKTIWNHLTDSKLSWKEYFSSNPMHVIDTKENKTIWSSKCHE